MNEARLKVGMWALGLAVAAWFVVLTGLETNAKLKTSYAYHVSTTLTEGEYATTIGRKIEPGSDPADEIANLRRIFRRVH